MNINVKYDVEPELIGRMDIMPDFQEHILRELSLEIGENFYKECRKSGVLYPFEYEINPERYQRTFSIHTEIYPSDIIEEIRKEIRSVYNERINDDFVRTEMNKIMELLKWIPEVKD